MPEVVGAIPFMGISMTVYDILKRTYIQHYNNDPSVVANLLTGGLSGFCGMIFAYPLGLVRVTL